MLLVRRGHVPQRGKWSLAAGFVDVEEEPRLAAGRGELEETGRRVRICGLQMCSAARFIPEGPASSLFIEVRSERGSLIPGDDADGVAFFGLDGLPPPAFESTPRVLQSAGKAT
jgi:8-oxo-dGTP diphosphatase